MDRSDVYEKLTGIFRKVLSNDSLEISDELTANDVENWDSLSHMLLITEVEETFSIKFRLKELNKMHNVGEMVDIIISKL
ncbi:acyl carrier protein [Carboxylicivirga caseinilyticus]|uniref:acyl carrier protein n=1 Tax=Carboxylicivirga caseinilyticus TaxID=3417572 RepID=UPI002AA66C32|nr:acyl carrier protein [uncultured Carboxylicivirga sp.]MCU4166222.1 acyl carrier protein [Marinilabiliaceae bacterium A049]